MKTWRGCLLALVCCAPLLAQADWDEEYYGPMKYQSGSYEYEDAITVEVKADQQTLTITEDGNYETWDLEIRGFELYYNGEQVGIYAESQFVLVVIPYGSQCYLQYEMIITGEHKMDYQSILSCRDQDDEQITGILDPQRSGKEQASRLMLAH